MHGWSYRVDAILVDLYRNCGVEPVAGGRSRVCFVGPDAGLPMDHLRQPWQGGTSSNARKRARTERVPCWDMPELGKSKGRGREEGGGGRGCLSMQVA